MAVRFESSKDIEREKKVMQLIAKGQDYKKLGDYNLDYLITGKAYIEIKNYNNPSSKYSNFIVSIIKLTKMQKADRILPTYYFLNFTDELYYIRCIDIQGNVRYGGREKREGSTNDQELLVWMPKEQFKIYK